MAGNSSDFNDLMAEAHRAAVALDGVTRRDGPRVKAAPVENAKRVYSQLLAYRRTARTTPLEAHAFHEALEHLQARLKFIGEPI